MKRRRVLPITFFIKVRDAAEFRDSREPPLRIGDIVMLNSGGPKMMVVDHDGDTITCAWRETSGAAAFAVEATLPRACVHRVSVVE